MKPENILKGKMAKVLIEELLKKCKNRVYRFSHGEFLERLEQTEKSFSRENKAGIKISSIPDFLVITKKEKQIFLKIKFRSIPETIEEELLLERDALEKFWRAKIILVTSGEEPYFRVLTPPYFAKEKREGWPIPVLNWLPLEDNPELNINSKEIKEFNKLVEKYYLKK